MDHLKSLAIIWIAIATKLSIINQKSLSTFHRRLTLDFLTKELPHLGKDVDRSLTSGVLVVTAPFKKLYGTAYPVFLNEMFSLIYDKEGYLIHRENVKILRQLLMVFYKFELQFTASQQDVAYQKFIATDKLVKTSFPDALVQPLQAIIKELMPDDPLDIRAHHSSGATECKINNAEKRNVRRYIPSLMKVYNPTYFFHSIEHCKQCWSSKPESSNPSSRVTLVPKDSRGPRIICIEPHERMFVQKGLMQKLYDHIESSSPARGRINFSNQLINRRLAQESSVDRRYATIDMKDASDLVSWELVKRTFPTDWVVALEATRSNSADVNGTTIELNKFAPMGSALCFPVEAIIFYSICRSITPEVWVYGDDIIVPTELADTCMSRLEEYGLIVNRDKSLVDGFFRESCGGDYYHGDDISTLKLKRLDLVSTIAFANNMVSVYGEPLIGDSIIGLLETNLNTVVFRMKASLASDPEPLVYYTDNCSASYVFFRKKYDHDLQRDYIRRLAPQTRGIDASTLTDDDLYFEWLTNSTNSSTPLEDYRIQALTRDLTYVKKRTLMPATSRGIKFVQPKLGYTWAPFNEGDYS